MNTTDISKFVYKEALIECHKLIPIGAYTIILFVVGIIANPYLIFIILTNKELLNPLNLLKISTAILNLIGVLLELPMVSVSAFMCRFPFGKNGCSFEAFVMYFVGCSNVYILMFISCFR